MIVHDITVVINDQTNRHLHLCRDATECSEDGKYRMNYNISTADFDAQNWYFTACTVHILKQLKKIFNSYQIIGVYACDDEYL